MRTFAATRGPSAGGGPAARRGAPKAAADPRMPRVLRNSDGSSADPRVEVEARRRTRTRTSRWTGSGRVALPTRWTRRRSGACRDRSTTSASCRASRARVAIVPCAASCLTFFPCKYTNPANVYYPSTTTQPASTAFDRKFRIENALIMTSPRALVLIFSERSVVRSMAGICFARSSRRSAGTRQWQSTIPAAMMASSTPLSNRTSCWRPSA